MPDFRTEFWFISDLIGLPGSPSIHDVQQRVKELVELKRLVKEFYKAIDSAQGATGVLSNPQVAKAFALMVASAGAYKE